MPLRTSRLCNLPRGPRRLLVLSLRERRTTFAVALPLAFGSMPAAKAGASIQISLKDRYLKVFDEGREVARYTVAMGAPESPTLPG